MPKSVSPRDTAATATKALTIEVVGADALSYYTNNTSVETTVWDVKLRFAETLQVDRNKGIMRVRELATVRMSPQHARVIVKLLSAQLDRYERNFGKIPSAEDASSE